MDQYEEEQQEEEDHSKRSTDQRKEAEEEKEEDTSEESMDRRTEEKNSRELEDEQKTEAEEVRSCDDSEEEAAMAAWSLFAHACSVLQCVVQAWACRLGLLHHDSFGDPKASIAAPAGAAPADSSSARESAGEEDTKTSAGFYMQEVITRVRAVRIRPQPPSKPREGSGGNGGEHQ